ncbi:hypothetical protein RB3048 [Rhodopirellula baltica SH 1]|uniref:Uncharacterized protein n=1 Tax=Rhodopirellula baltica (strain DSM 10527 / NCIMB 13988 / SH1) TaxID=243090 RepID=Q7UUV0_RHOBA|nr:hypothetical protein RB3048 [Rhodopirellula baltica SH 1]
MPSALWRIVEKFDQVDRAGRVLQDAVEKYNLYSANAELLLNVSLPKRGMSVQLPRCRSGGLRRVDIGVQEPVFAVRSSFRQRSRSSSH